MRRFAAEIFCERATIEVRQGRLIAPIIQASILSKTMGRLLVPATSRSPWQCCHLKIQWQGTC